MSLSDLPRITIYVTGGKLSEPCAQRFSTALEELEAALREEGNFQVDPVVIIPAPPSDKRSAMFIRADALDEDGVEEIEVELGPFVQIEYKGRDLVGTRPDGTTVSIGYCHRSAFVGGLLEEMTGCGNPGQFKIELKAEGE